MSPLLTADGPITRRICCLVQQKALNSELLPYRGELGLVYDILLLAPPSRAFTAFNPLEIPARALFHYCSDPLMTFCYSST